MQKTKSPSRWQASLVNRGFFFRIFSASALTASLASLVSLAYVRPALALTSYTPTTLNALGQELVGSLVQTVALGADHRAYQSAAPLGAVIGLDLGVDLTSISAPAEFQQAIQLAGAGTPPSAIPLPRLNIRKGFPFKLDVGFSYVAFQENSLLGFDAQYALLKGGAASFAAALRGSYTMADLFFMQTRTMKLDAVISKNFLLIEPYVGAGVIRYSGEVVVPTGQSLAPGISAEDSGATGHFFVGLPLKLAILHITAEYDLNFAGVNTFGVKTSLSF
jgi:hypothetical protein